MKVISYNLNGVRAAMRKGLGEWLNQNKPDIACFQEIKAYQEQIDETYFNQMGYYCFWHPAEKKGYSGVGTITKAKPRNVETGMGYEEFDHEGRVQKLDFDDFTLVNVYIPSGTTGTVRQDFKYKWLDAFYDYIKKLMQVSPRLLIGGDYNICHKPIDIHNPQANKNSSGFLPEERAWLDSLIDLGFIDTFRYFNQEPHYYTWWSYRANAREKNKGWRIDYQMATHELEQNLKNALINSDAKHSDHCPAFLDIQ